MIRVYHREYHDRMLLTVEGHSEFAPKGMDIVCAGASTLALTLLNCLKDEDSAGRLRLTREFVRDGYLFLEIEYFDFSRERTEAIIETVISGFYMLSEEFPENISVDG